MSLNTKNSTPLVSADELEALLSGAGTERTSKVDVYFPLRMFFLSLIIGSWIIRLLFFTDGLAAQLTQSAETAAKLIPYLYFRGWFLVVILCVGLYSYNNNWYPALVGGGLLLSSTVNFLFDGFSVYAEALGNPSGKVTFFLLLRFFAMYLLFLQFRNAARIPLKHERWNLLLAWKKPAHSQSK
jgi:hypothetical protein